MSMHTYEESTDALIDPRRATEQVRQTEQSRLLTEAMGGVLAEQQEPGRVESVLDLACGSGEWVLEVARLFPSMQVTGIDSCAPMLSYARALARAEQSDQVCFTEMDLRWPLPIEDQTFDLINGRLLVGILDQASWPQLLAEGYRLLKPAGIMRLSEYEIVVSSSPALQRLHGLLCQALAQAGRGFSVDGHSLGIVHRLGLLLREAGFGQIQQRPFVLDTSASTPHSHQARRLTELTYELLKPALLKWGVVDEPTFEHLYRQMQLDLLNVDFACMTFGLTVWGTKPAATEQRGPGQP